MTLTGIRMRKICLIAMVISTQVTCQENDYWEQVFRTSIDRQAQAEIANFQEFPVKVEPSSVFGMRTHPITQEYKIHNGTDLPGTEGAPFSAVAHGEVVFSGENGGLGLMITIDHGDGILTRYGHAKELLYTVGDKVRRGDVIGKIGSTGQVTGPHVHYEIIKDGENIDPEIFVAERRGLSVEEFRKQLLEGPSISIDTYVDNLLTKHKASSNENLNTISQEQNAKEVESFVQIVSSQSDKYEASVIEKVKQSADSVTSKISEVVNTQVVESPEFQKATLVATTVNFQDALSDSEVVTAPNKTEPAVLLQVTKEFLAEPNNKQPLLTNMTLWSLAQQIKPKNATVYQSMVAIYNANPEAFPSGNMNNRYLNVALTLPSANDIETINPQVALDKCKEHLASFTNTQNRPTPNVNNAQNEIAPN